MKNYLVQKDGCWQLPITNYSVAIAPANPWLVEINFNGQLGIFTLQIESQFTFRATNGNKVILDPAREIIKTIAKIPETVKLLKLYEDGKIKVIFTEDCYIEVEPSDEFEPWNLFGPNQFKVVSVPSHKLNIWHNK